MDQKDRAAIIAGLDEDVVVSRVNIKGRSYGPCYCCGRDLGVGCSVIGLSGDQDLKACSKSDECRILAGKRIADLEALVANQKTSIEALQDWNRTARVEALREVKLWCHHQRTGWRSSEATDLMLEILSMLNGLIAGAKQPAPAESEPETGEDNENGQFGVGA